MRVDWCVSSWFRIKNTHSHARLGLRSEQERVRAALGSVRRVRAALGSVRRVRAALGSCAKMCYLKERKQTTQGRDGRTVHRHHTGIF